VAAAGGGVQYVGDQGQRLMQVDVSRQMSTGDDGRSIFQSVQGGAGYVASSAASNTGSAVFGSISIADATATNYGKDFTITFNGGNYTVMTKDVPPVVAGAGAYTAGSPVNFGGVQIKFTGKPADGDSFDVSTAQNAGTDVFAAIGQLVTALRTPLAGELVSLDALIAAQTQVRSAADALRARPVQVALAQALVAAESAMASASSRVLALLDQHDALRVDAAVAPFAGVLRDSGARLAFARQLFNEAAQTYDDAVHQFPTRLLISLYGFGPAGRI
jgi:flagellar hook-associated protein 3 FlgL